MKEHLSCSELTKRKIAQGLKELMVTTSFNKITVSDISNKSNVHRQTFYYHFNDKYELLNWIIENEIINEFTNDFCYENMYDKFRTVFETMYQNKKFYQNAFKINMGDVFNFIANVSENLLEDLIKEISQKYSITTTTDFEVIADFFGFGLGGVLISWANKDMTDTPEEMTEKIKSFVESFSKILSNK